MESKELSRQEYVARINRVMDYVGQNLDGRLDLAVMAGVASFSPYHFHRIFSYITGETPSDFVARVRLEKTAQLLGADPKTPVGDIAMMCGFVNASSFSRAFKAHFGVTTSEFRRREKALYVKDGIRYDKNGKAVSKIGKHPQRINPQFCSVEFNQLIIMDTKIEIKQNPELNLIYVRHTGAFNKIGEAYEKLFRWAGPRGLVTPEARTVTVYHDDPAITAIEKVRQDASLLVVGDVKVDGEIGRSTVPAGKYAVGRFEIRETEFEQAWNTMCSWLTESGYQPADSPTYEFYHNDYCEHPEHKFIVDICIPVKPL
jgi:AraC family transcriptional regulator